MIFISQEAKKQVDTLKASAGVGEDYFVRVSVVGRGCSRLTYKMHFDNESKANDKVYQDNGENLRPDLHSFLYVCGTTLEFSRGLDGKGFYFSNPNASRSCGCGESFAV